VDVAGVGPDGVAGARSAGADLQLEPRAALEYIGLPNAKAPFDRPVVRRALSLALDRPRVIQAGLGGAGVPATAFLPPNVGDVPGCAGAPPAADIAAAIALLREAHVSLDGVVASFYFNDEYGNRAVVEEVANQWRAAVGLDARPTPLSWDDYLAKGQGSPGFDGPFRGSWRGAYVGADPYLGPLFHSTAIGQTNLARFNDRVFDRTLDHGARETTDDTGRALDYRNLAELLCDRMPVIPVAVVAGGTLVRKAKVGSATESYATRADGLPLLRELFIR
jgi:ABC-type oligopeptide transport system substrate-binding subunit